MSPGTAIVQILGISSMKRLRNEQTELELDAEWNKKPAENFMTPSPIDF